MNSAEAFTFLQQATGLKYVPRSGWVMRGLTDVESVAEHAWGTTLVSLVLLGSIEESLNREKALTIALLHDLPERVLTDIPSPAARYLPPGAKKHAETAIMEDLLTSLPNAEELHDWWLEFETSASPEGRLVRDADRLDLLFQAYDYEESRGCRLEDFWENQQDRPFFFPAAQAIYDALVADRSAKRTEG